MHENLAVGSLCGVSFFSPSSSWKLEVPILVQVRLVESYMKFFYASNSAVLVYQRTAVTA